MTSPPPAPLLRRGAAAALDAAVGLLAWGLGAAWLAIGVRVLRPDPAEPGATLLLIGAVLLLGPALQVVYHLGFIGGCGQTPGRMALGIAVVRSSGEPAGLGRALVRLLGGGLSLGTLGLVNVPLLLLPGRRGLGDRMAGTRVVRV